MSSLSGHRKVLTQAPALNCFRLEPQCWGRTPSVVESTKPSAHGSSSVTQDGVRRDPRDGEEPGPSTRIPPPCGLRSCDKSRISWPRCSPRGHLALGPPRCWSSRLWLKVKSWQCPETQTWPPPSLTTWFSKPHSGHSAHWAASVLGSLGLAVAPKRGPQPSTTEETETQVLRNLKTPLPWLPPWELLQEAPGAEV